MRPDFFQREGELAAITPGLAHPEDSAGADFNSSLFEVTDGVNAFLISMGGADFGEKAAGAFEIVIVTFATGLFEPVGDCLALDNTQGGIGTGLAGLFEFLKMIADLVQNGPFLQAAPGGDEAQGGDAVSMGFLRGSA